MKKLLLVIAVTLSMLATSAFAKGKEGDIHIFVVNNKDLKITPLMFEEAFNKANFSIGLNSNIQDGLHKVYDEGTFQIYNALSIFDNDLSIRIVKEDADAGVLLPMGVAFYQRKGEDTLKIAVLRKEAQTKLTGSKSKHLDTLEKKVIKIIKSVVPNATHGFNDERLDATRVLLTKHTMDLKGRDWEDMKDTLEENFEEQFEEVGFVMPSYFDHMEMLGEDSQYDFYITYSICKLAVIRAVSKVKPEAAAFAPCTTMIYKKKNEDKIVMGFTSVYNWLSSASIEDKPSVDALTRAQKAFEGVLVDVTSR